MAQTLSEQFSYDELTREPLELEPDQTYKRSHDPRELLAAYLSAAGRGKRFVPPSPESFSGIVTHKIVSVSSKIIYVLRRLWKNAEIGYAALFEEKKEKSELVATFLAVLELVKGKRVRIEGESDAAVIRLVKDAEKHEVKRWKSRSSKGQ